MILLIGIKNNISNFSFKICTYKDKTMNVKIRNNEFNENDTSEYIDCLESLKKVSNRINRQEVILWFNENDIDYFNMTDIEMYVMYIEKNAVSK